MTGLRLAHRSDFDRFSRIGSLADLRQVSFGSVEHWADTSIMKDAGLKVVTGSTYDGRHPSAAPKSDEKLFDPSHFSALP